MKYTVKVQYTERRTGTFTVLASSAEAAKHIAEDRMANEYAEHSCDEWSVETLDVESTPYACTKRYPVEFQNTELGDEG